MKHAIEAYVMAILIFFLTVAGVYYYAASLQNEAADNFLTAIIGQIEASDGSETVIDKCIEIAGEKGYQVTVEPTVMYENLSYYYVTLTYEYSIPFAGKREITKEGYAR